MIAAVIDTHAIIWWLYNDPRLSAGAAEFVEKAGAEGKRIGVSSITFIEVVYLIEKGRIAAETLTMLAEILRSADGVFEEIPVSLEIARAMSRVNVVQVPDMPDRIIAATAVHLHVPVISKDGKIRLSDLVTIW